MEALLMFIVLVLFLYATGKLSSKNEARVKQAIDRIKELFTGDGKSA